MRKVVLYSKSHEATGGDDNKTTQGHITMTKICDFECSHRNGISVLNEAVFLNDLV